MEQTYLMIDCNGKETDNLYDCYYVVIMDSEKGIKDFRKLCKEDHKIILPRYAEEFEVEFIVKVCNENEEDVFMSISSFALGAILNYHKG